MTSENWRWPGRRRPATPRRSFPLLAGVFADHFELADARRGGVLGRNRQRGADLLRARLRLGEALLERGGEVARHRVELLALGVDLGEQASAGSLDGAATPSRSSADWPPDRARPRRARWYEPAIRSTSDAGRRFASSTTTGRVPRLAPPSRRGRAAFRRSFRRGRPGSRRAARPHRRPHGPARAGLAEAIENLAQLVAHTFAGGGQRGHRCAGVALDRFAERRAGLLDLARERAQELIDRFRGLRFGDLGRGA